MERTRRSGRAFRPPQLQSFSAGAFPHCWVAAPPLSNAKGANDWSLPHVARSVEAENSPRAGGDLIVSSSLMG